MDRGAALQHRKQRDRQRQGRAAGDQEQSLPTGCGDDRRGEETGDGEADGNARRDDRHDRCSQPLRRELGRQRADIGQAGAERDTGGQPPHEEFGGGGRGRGPEGGEAGGEAAGHDQRAAPEPVAQRGDRRPAEAKPDQQRGEHPAEAGRDQAQRALQPRHGEGHGGDVEAFHHEYAAQQQERDYAPRSDHRLRSCPRPSQGLFM